MYTVNINQTEKSIQHYTNCLVAVAEKNGGSDLLQEARAVASQFEELFSKFAACHNGYSVAKKLNKEEINQLGRLVNINTGMSTRILSSCS